MGTPGRGPRRRTCPKTSELEQMRGRMLLGMLKASRSSSSHLHVSMFMSMVREALETSVMCLAGPSTEPWAPPVRFQMSELAGAFDVVEHPFDAGCGEVDGGG